MNRLSLHFCYALLGMILLGGFGAGALAPSAQAQGNDDINNAVQNLLLPGAPEPEAELEEEKGEAAPRPAGAAKPAANPTAPVVPARATTIARPAPPPPPAPTSPKRAPLPPKETKPKAVAKSPVAAPKPAPKQAVKAAPAKPAVPAKPAAAAPVAAAVKSAAPARVAPKGATAPVNQTIVEPAPRTGAPVVAPPTSVGESSGIESSSPAVSDSMAEESVDLSEDVASSFNPYLFQREPLWALLPLVTLLFLGLHLLPVPRRRRHKKIATEQFLTELRKTGTGGPKS